MKARPRYNGSVDSIAEALKPSVTCSTWLTYGQQASAKLNKPLCFRHRVMLRKLAQLMPTLAFKRADLKNAMAKVRESTRGNWPQDIPDEEEISWGDVQVARLTTMMRHASQAHGAQRA